MRKDKQSDFKRLFMAGVTKEDICNQLSISERTYYRFCSDMERPRLAHNRKTIIFEKYYNTVFYGNFHTKMDISKALKVSNKTLTNYEQDGAMKKAAQYMFVCGLSVQDIADRLHTEQITVENMVCGLSSMESIKKELEKAVEVLRLVSDIDVAIYSKISKIEKLVKTLF